MESRSSFSSGAPLEIPINKGRRQRSEERIAAIERWAERWTVGPWCDLPPGSFINYLREIRTSRSALAILGCTELGLAMIVDHRLNPGLHCPPFVSGEGWINGFCPCLTYIRYASLSLPRNVSVTGCTKLHNTGTSEHLFYFDGCTS
jgi:hypothetical protein